MQIPMSRLACHLLVPMERRGIISLLSNSPRRTRMVFPLLNRTNCCMKTSCPRLAPFLTPRSIPLQRHLSSPLRVRNLPARLYYCLRLRRSRLLPRPPQLSLKSLQRTRGLRSMLKKLNLSPKGHVRCQFPLRLPHANLPRSMSCPCAKPPMVTRHLRILVLSPTAHRHCCPIFVPILSPPTPCPLRFSRNWELEMMTGLCVLPYARASVLARCLSTITALRSTISICPLFPARARLVSRTRRADGRIRLGTIYLRVLMPEGSAVPS